MNWKKKIIFLIWLIFAATNFSFGQSYETFVLLLPYELQIASAQRIGAATVALPDRVPHILPNPANLVESKNITFFSSTRARTTRLSYHEVDMQSDKSYSRNDFELPAYSSFSLPFNLFNTRWALAAAYNGIQYLEMAKSNLPVKLVSADNENNRYSFSMGLAGQLLTNIRLGISWTKWYGENDQQFDNTSDRFTFHGSVSQVGVQGQLKKLAVGLVVYVPHDLIENNIRRIDLDSLFLENKFKKDQRFNGAIDFGLAYNLSSKWTVGAGYGYQKSFSLKDKRNAWQFQQRFSGASKFSLGSEYALSLSTAKLPVYLGYKLQQIPVSSHLNYFFDFVSIESKNSLLQHEMLLGAGLIFKNFGIFLDSKWSQSSFCMQLLSSPASAS